MTLDISLWLVAKLFVAGGCIAGTAIVTLWPVNDQPVSRTQFVVFGLLSALWVSLIFGFISLNFTK